MPAKDGFQLQAGDIEILRIIHELRLAEIGHVSSLSGRSLKALRARLLKLTQRHYLASPKRFMQKKCYAVGSEGIPVLIEGGFARQNLAGRRLRDHELKEIFIRHTLFISDILARLMLQARTSRIAIVETEHDGPALWDQATGTDRRGRETIFPVRPDLKLTLKDGARPDGKNVADFFVEADRGTMSGNDMEDKIRGYLAYHRQQRYMQRHPGMKMFQVLTVTETRTRAKYLESRLAPILPSGPARRAYQFVPLEDLTLEGLFPPLPQPPT